MWDGKFVVMGLLGAWVHKRLEERVLRGPMNDASPTGPNEPHHGLLAQLTVTAEMSSSHT